MYQNLSKLVCNYIIYILVAMVTADLKPFLSGRIKEIFLSKKASGKLCSKDEIKLRVNMFYRCSMYLSVCVVVNMFYRCSMYLSVCVVYSQHVLQVQYVLVCLCGI